VLRRMIKPNGGFEVQFFSSPHEIDHRNAVSKYVVNPSDLFWLRVDDDGVIQKSLTKLSRGLNISRCSPNLTGRL
jgi:hypothetical protein